MLIQAGVYSPLVLECSSVWSVALLMISPFQDSGLAWLIARIFAVLASLEVNCSSADLCFKNCLLLSMSMVCHICSEARGRFQIP